MKAIAVTLVAIFLTAAAIYTISSATPSLTTQQPTDLSLVYLGADQCTTTLQIECAVDIERTVVACAKAFETTGADIIADIKCAKDLLSDKKHCWPCICAEAKKKGWHVVGC